MSRVYASVLLSRPHLIKVGGQEISVRAVQVPIHKIAQRNLAQKVESALLRAKTPERLSLGRGAALELKFEERHGESEVYSLIYDEPGLLPTCNFRNDTLNQAGFQAIEIAPGASPESVAEAKVTLQTAGRGHWGRLLHLQSLPEFNFIIDKLEVIYPYLSRIENSAMRDFTTRAITNAFTEFFIGPSSTGGKYHPADEVVLQGLVSHTKRVAEVALKLCAALRLPPETQDEILSAALLHDICKSVTIAEDGNFVWGFHTVDDHSVIAARWLESLPGSEAEAVKRVIRSVYYHSNIWTPNVDTALTDRNSISDWVVSLADIVAGLKNVRVHYPGEPGMTEEETANGLLERPFELEVEKLHKNWKKLCAEQKKAVYLAEQLFVQYDIKNPADQQKVLEKIFNTPRRPKRPVELAKNRLAFATYACQLIPHLPGMEIFLREDIARVMAQVECPPVSWNLPKVKPESKSRVAKRLQRLFFEEGRYEARQKLKLRFLGLLNKRVKGDKVVGEEELADELLLALMMKYGTLDVEKIYRQVYEMWAERDAIREVLRSKEQTAIARLEEIQARSEYSGSEIGRVEEEFRERLNAALGEEYIEGDLKPVDKNVAKVLKEKLGAETAQKILDDLRDADAILSRRGKPKTAVAFLKRILGDKEIDDRIHDLLVHELEYRQRYPFNRMNRQIVGWLMHRYKTSNPEELFEIIYQRQPPARRKRIVKILQKYEAETRRLENCWIGREGKSGIPKKEKDALLSRARAELEKLLPAPRVRAEVNAGKIPELEDLATFAVRNRLSTREKTREYLDWARNEKVIKEYQDLPGIERAKTLIMEKIDRIDQGEKIVVYGDYDADGVMGTVILVETLREIAAHRLRQTGKCDEEQIRKMVEEQIQFYIPDRKRGYGLNNQSLEELMVGQGFTTVITTDNGIGNKDEVQFAKSKGATVIITDHHSLHHDAAGKVELPRADALVHPKLLPENHPKYHLVGAGVALELAYALYDAAGLDSGNKYIECAAIATITDVAPMPRNSLNIPIVRRGFRKFGAIYKRLREAEEKERERTLAEQEGEGEEIPKVDLEAAFDDQEFAESGLAPGLYLLCKLLKISSFDRDRIGFGLGPALNAVGRLAEASLAVKLLLARDKEEALRIAEKLIAYNEQRKEIQQKITEEALALLEGMIKDKVYNPATMRAVVIADENWHKGVVGIVASEIAERIGGIAAIGRKRSGSMRAIPGMDVMRVLHRAVEIYQKDGNRGSFFQKYGGHAGAAGYRLKEDSLGDFRTYLGKATEEIYSKKIPRKSIRADIPQLLERVSVSQYEVMDQYGPFGRETYGKTDEVPKPTFASQRVKVVDWSTFGANKQHLEITFEDERGRRIKGICFKANNLAAKKPLWKDSPDEEIFVDIVYKLDLDYKGSPQLIIEDVKV